MAWNEYFAGPSVKLTQVRCVRRSGKLYGLRTVLQDGTSATLLSATWTSSLYRTGGLKPETRKSLKRQTGRTGGEVALFKAWLLTLLLLSHKRSSSRSPPPFPIQGQRSSVRISNLFRVGGVTSKAWVSTKMFASMRGLFFRGCRETAIRR